jgi:hypothetical protein
VVGCWLNLDRQQARQAVAVWAGATAAVTGYRPYEFFAAFAETAVEAQFHFALSESRRRG